MVALQDRYRRQYHILVSGAKFLFAPKIKMRRTILVSSHIFYHAKTLNLLLLLHTIQFSTTHLLHTFAMEIHRIL